jgi:thiol-disulfide isomerase/thioredoxin
MLVQPAPSPQLQRRAQPTRLRDRKRGMITHNQPVRQTGGLPAVQFWTFGCNNCQATWPHMRDLYTKYGGDDFEIVGIHAPEFDFERDVDAVAAAAEANGLAWPIAIDNEKLNFRSWQERRFWPRIFLIDRAGNVRYDHIGEGAYDEIDTAVGALIAERR